jgi:hypothetical protein
MVSTHFKTKMARRAKLYSVTTAFASTGVGYFTTGWGAEGTKIPGFHYTTANTYVNYPVENPGADMMFYIIYNGPSLVSTVNYACVAVQKRPSTAGGFIDSTGDSTAEKAFDLIYSTAMFAATSTEAQGFLLGPIDTQRYGCNYLASSSGDVDKYQSFIRMMVGYSTAVAAVGVPKTTLAVMSTSVPGNGYHIAAFAVGSTID